MIVIRKATDADVTLLTEMGRETFAAAFGPDNTPENMTAYLKETYNKEKVTKEFTDMNSQFFLAFDGETPVGYAKVKVNGEAKNVLKESSIELERIYVVTNFQGKKVGSTLLKTCLNHAQEAGFYWIWLGVWEHNYKAQNFYAKWGFEKFGEHVFQMGDDPQTDWIMKKRLEQLNSNRFKISS